MNVQEGSGIAQIIFGTSVSHRRLGSKTKGGLGDATDIARKAYMSQRKSGGTFLGFFLAIQ